MLGQRQESPNNVYSITTSTHAASANMLTKPIVPKRYCYSFLSDRNMGYYETYCQICGVSFTIARNRRADEPHSAAWDYTGSVYPMFILVEQFDETYRDGTGSGCKILDDGQDRLQHLVGPGYASLEGYSGHRVSVEEM